MVDAGAVAEARGDATTAVAAREWLFGDSAFDESADHVVGLDGDDYGSESGAAWDRRF